MPVAAPDVIPRDCKYSIISAVDNSPGCDSPNLMTSLNPDPNANSDLIVNALYNGIDLIHNGLENLKHIYSGFYDSINQLYNIQINQELKNVLESLVGVIGIDQKALEESERKVKDDSDD